MKLNKQMITGIGGGVLAVVVIVLISAAGARKKEAAKHLTQKKMEQSNAARPVRFETVQAGPLEQLRSFPGIVKASEESALSLRVSGPLVEVNVTLGEPVKKGDLLMQIDPRDFEDHILSLEAQLAGALAVRNGAEKDYQRVAGLFKEKVVPQSDYDHAKSGFDSSEAAVKAIQAQLQMARHALEDTSLRAPYDGTASAQRVENHELVKAGQVVMQYHNIQQLEIVINVPENEAANAPLDTENIAAYVTFPALAGERYEARLKEWSTTANPMTRTYAATFELEAPKGGRIMPGMTAKVSFSKAEDQTLVLTVPVSAVVSDDAGGSCLWIYDREAGCAVRRPVRVGALAGASRVVITKGLSDGERVVVDGSRLLHENLSLKTASIK
jgi:RND family efflux transporter MFP subunit